MTLADLIKLYRAQSRDQVQPYLCDDELLALYATEGQIEACRRSPLLRDSVSAFCTVAFEAGAASVALDERVIQIERARISGHSIHAITAAAMDERHPGWQDAVRRDRPQVLVTNLSSGLLFLWPVPREAGEIKLTVQRLPLKALRMPTDKPEIRPELHRALVDWMLFRAYSREDTDLYNDTKAQLALDRFEAEFGRKRSGRNEAWVRDGVAAGPGPIA